MFDSIITYWRWKGIGKSVVLLSLFLFSPVTQNAVAQSTGVAFLEPPPLEQTEAVPGQYIILASHPQEQKFCTTHIPRDARRSISQASNTAACNRAHAGFSGLTYRRACEGLETEPRLLKLSKDRGIIFRSACKCNNFCKHAPRTEGPPQGLITR